MIEGNRYLFVMVGTGGRRVDWGFALVQKTVWIESVSLWKLLYHFAISFYVFCTLL